MKPLGRFGVGHCDVEGKGISVLIRLALTFVLLAVLTPIPISAHESASAACDVNPVSADYLSSISREVEGQVLPMEGTFGSSPDQPEAAGATFAIERVEQRTIAVQLDGIDWIAMGRAQYFGGIDAAPSVPFFSLAEITGLLRQWTACAAQPDVFKLAAFFSEDGLRRLYASDDPYLVAESPAASLRSSSLSRTKGALPLLLFEARMLSDGRVAVIIGEGSSFTNGSNLATPTVPGSLWIFSRASGWRIDAVIGGFDSLNTAWVEI